MDTDTKENTDDNNASSSEINKNRPKNRGIKRKRKGSNSSSESGGDALPENALEVEQNVIASAKKNNLDDVSVKKLLKKVVTNDHVLAYVKLREEEEETSNEQTGVLPKLTRAKVKELMKVSPSTAPWNLEKIELTPIKHIHVKTRPEVKALIAQELPEDEDDDEYEPTNDDVPSDDDQGLESCSDIDSQPRTPATPRSVGRISPKVVKDGPFKVPQDVSTPSRRKLDMDEEEATIALRTRSKLSLSETPIEHIESSFVPPDDLPVPPVDDHLWNDFLNECLNPASVSRNEDDDEADPEYNVAADPDAHDEDEEALENTIIKISKKELNDLVTELFNIMPESTVDYELNNMANSVLTEHSQSEVNNTSARWEGKQEPLSDEERPLKISEKLTFERQNTINSMSVGKTEPPEDPLAVDVAQTTNEVPNEQRNGLGQSTLLIVQVPQPIVMSVQEQQMGVMPAPAPAQIPPAVLQQQPGPPVLEIKLSGQPVMQPEQILILQQQLRQHVQLATTSFLQLYVHPLHWTMAPPFKEYLVSLVKMADANPLSVAGVCNLRPALELAQEWERTVAKDTTENAEMISFIQKEADRWKRCTSQNRPYLGVFHETFCKVVANSSVFLYPYLLPAMPCVPEFRRRYHYLRSEDELIVIGLDQFWQYIELNPELFPKLGKSNSRHRWGLNATAELMIKYMFPWHQNRPLMQHIMSARKQPQSISPISKYFSTNKVTPVKHKLLPFNSKMTLYEQPEHEMPDCWLKYLAKSSKRFKEFMRLRSRKSKIAREPEGEDIVPGMISEPVTKKPLPIDFTKEIKRTKPDATSPTPDVQDKLDINIEKEQPFTFYKLVETSEGHTLVPLAVNTDENTSNITITPKPISELTNIKINNLPTNSVETNTVDSNVAPITSTVEVKNVKSILTTSDDNHCSCCKLLKQICKVKQSVITDFFSRKNSNVSRKKCECNENKYPTITKRLKLLISRYKVNSKLLFDEIERKLNISKLREHEENANLDGKSEEYSIEDIAFVTAFQMKLTIRASVAKNVYIKGRINKLFSKFNLDGGDPVSLALEFEHNFGAEMVDMFKEFMGFLNPEQADTMNHFKDYFINNCAEDLIKKIEEQVKDESTKHALLSQLSWLFTHRSWSACAMCTALLELLHAHPALARYTFGLFPHKRRHVKNQSTTNATPASTSSSPNPVNGGEPLSAPSENTAETRTEAANGPPPGVNYEADHSSSSDSEEDIIRTTEGYNFSAVIKAEPPASVVRVANEMPIMKSEIQDDSDTDMSMTIVSEDESIKSEPLEWKREEDKLILEMLQQHLTPEERNDKTILEIIEEKRIVPILTESLTDKSYDEIKQRVIYILRLLVMGEQ